MQQLTEKTAVGALIVSTATKRVLLNMRSPHKTHGYHWSLWGGMMEENEIPKETLLRELREEMGFVPDIERIYPFDIFESRDKSFRYYTFVCIVKEEFVPQINKEAVGYSWVNFGLWPKPMHFGAKKSLTTARAMDKLRLILDQH